MTVLIANPRKRFRRRPAPLKSVFAKFALLFFSISTYLQVGSDVFVELVPAWLATTRPFVCAAGVVIDHGMCFSWMRKGAE